MVTEKQMANLRVLSPKEARENGKKGGKASGESRRRLKTFREAAIDNMTAEKREKMLKVLEAMVEAGDMRAWELYLKLLGQHPDQEQVNTEPIEIRIKGLESYGD